MAASSDKNASTTVGKMSTKELARSLGLIRKLSSSTKKSEIRVKKQPFTYLVVIDFESTCWKDKRMGYAPEIIEFPAVLMHTSTGVIESEFHHYVQPSEHPRLSDFCKELTGITQSQVDDGIPIGTCLMLFNKWLQELCNKKNIKFLSHALKATEIEQNSETNVKWCTFVTWSDWDIGICLKNECQRKRHLVPQPVRSWIDLRAAYKTFYSRKPNGLAGALKDLGIQFTGRQHFGLDDARNTARLAWRMIKDGCVMNVTSSIDASVSVLHQIIQNGFKRKKPSKEPKKNILQSIGAQNACEASLENQLLKSNFKNTDCTSVHGETDLVVKNARPQTNPDPIGLKTDISKPESKENFAVLPENQTQDATIHSVQSLLAPPVLVAGSTSIVNAVSNKTDESKTLVSPVTCLTSLTSFTGQRCLGSEARHVRETAVSNAGLLKRKLPNGVDSPIAAKRGLVKQTLGTRLPTNSLGLRDRSFVVKTSASPKMHARKRPVSIGNNQENTKPNTTGPKSVCKSSNVAEFKSKNPRLVDRTNLLSGRTLDVVTNARASETSNVKNVEKFSEVRQQNGTKVAEKMDQENRIKVVNSAQGVFKTPKPVSSARRERLSVGSVGHSSLNTKMTVTPKNVKHPCVTPLSVSGRVTVTPKNVKIPCVTPLSVSGRVTVTPKNVKSPCVTPLSISGSVTPVLRFNGGSVTPPFCECGRRARRLTVGKPGPNQGRVFYACSVRNNRSSFGKSPVKKGKKNCKFFCWEPKGVQMSPFQRTLQGTRVSETKNVELSFIGKP